jgi:hypothetical protein
MFRGGFFIVTLFIYLANYVIRIITYYYNIKA